MLATPGPLPHGAGWTFEVKWDGMRLLAEAGGDGPLTLRSRSGRDVTSSFPELSPLAGLERRVTLDGEVVALDNDGSPSFSRLSERIGAQAGRAAVLARRTPVTYLVFDLLAVDGRALTGEEFRARRTALLELVLPPGPFVVPETFDDGDALLRAVTDRGLEGVVAKRWDAPYRPGTRSPAWVKHSLRTATDAVVLGWRSGATGEAASLVLATAADDGSLVYRGSAGSGLSQQLGQTLTAALPPAAGPPDAAGLREDVDRLVAAGVVWCQPQAVVEVTHLGLTGSGRFRQPVVERYRPDLAPGDLGARPAVGREPGTRRSAAEQGDPVRVAVAGRTLRISHLDKVLYPATGTTKAQVVAFYTRVAPHLLALAADRPITRRRWPDGVGAPSFFEKNLPAWAPPWIRRVQLPTSKDPITYPVLADEEVAAVVWLAAHAALELHTPQWRLDAAGRPLPPDRLVIDLDPGPGAGLAECAEVAELVSAALAGEGLAVHPVLSGSKGLHLYAPLPTGPTTADEVTEQVRRIAEQVRGSAPGLVVTTMAKQARAGRVFVDWSQNRAAKTTLAPWSLRGAASPTVALPISWEEVRSPDLHQVGLAEALDRLERGAVPVPW